MLPVLFLSTRRPCFARTLLTRWLHVIINKVHSSQTSEKKMKLFFSINLLYVWNTFVKNLCQPPTFSLFHSLHPEKIQESSSNGKSRQVSHPSRPRQDLKRKFDRLDNEAFVKTPRATSFWPFIFQIYFNLLWGGERGGLQLFG